LNSVLFEALFNSMVASISVHKCIKIEEEEEEEEEE
jgi:hypothetical protein